jgi:hypothetical protein
MTARFAFVYDALLEWVYEHGDNPLGIAEVIPFAAVHGITDLPEVFALLRYAKDKGTVDDEYSSMDWPMATLTAHGVEVVEERLRRRSSRVERSKAARCGLLNWLWRQKDDGVDLPVVKAVLEAQESLFEGARLTAEDMDTAAEYLNEKGFITGVRVDQCRGPVRAEITAKGMDCVEHFGGDTSAHERRSAGNTYNTYLPDAQGVIIGEQQNFTQNNTAGFDPSEFVKLAGFVGQISGTLGISEPERVELERVANALHEEATSPSPERGKLRELADRLKVQLLAAGTTMAANVGIEMVEKAIRSLTS